jgi:hypothetical protein
MNQLRLLPVLAVALAAAVCGAAEPASRPSEVDVRESPRPRIDPRADEALRKMSVALAGARSFSFRSVAAMEEPIATGQLAQFTRDTAITVRRPDSIVAESHQGDDVLVVCYQGTKLTVLSKTANTYASVEVPGRIDEMLDAVAEKHGLTLPLADLLFSDPYKVLTADALTGKYIGLHEVNAVSCHHLQFTQEIIDWQIWIDAGKEPVPRKFVIDYKSLPARPQFTALLSDWNLSAPAGDERFKLVLPKDAKKAELAQLLHAGPGE